MVRALAARGHEVTVCTTDAYDKRLRLPGPSRIRRAGARATRDEGLVEWRIFPNLSNRLAYDLQGFCPVGLSKYLRRHAADFDIAHLHACRNIPGVIAAAHLRRAGVPYVLAPNGTAPNLERRRIAKRLFDAVAGRRVMDEAARVLAVTAAEARQLRALDVPSARIATVPNPVALDEFDSPPAREPWRHRAGVGPETPVVAYLGQLTPRKRVDVLVRAFAALRAPGAVLAIGGNDMGAGGAVRAAVREHGLASRTVFTGLLEGRARLELLAAADVVVYPGAHEIFGLVPLEALLAGTPVVVADDSGCGEVIAATGGGLVVRGDGDAVCAALAQILGARSHWREAAARSAERVRALYAPDVVSARLERVYHEVVAA
jgi:glycosyltransferase involved in cell wall biosynthesis